MATIRAAVSIAATSAALLALAPGAQAQNADAEAMFNQAVALEDQGQIAEACDAFEASNRLEMRAGTLVRLGQCREKQGRLVSAWTAYKDALTRVKDPKKKKFAEGRVRALEPTLSYLTVLVPDDVRVDGLVVKRNGADLDPALWNRGLPVDGGTYTVVGSAPGHEQWQTTVEVATANDKAAVELPRFKAIATLVVPPPPPPEEVDEPPPSAPSPSAWTGRRKAALAIAGVGVAAIAGGVVLGLQAKGLEDDAFALCPDPAVPCADAARAQSLSDRSATRALLANVGYGVGGLAVAGAAVLWITGGPSRPAADRVSVAPHVGRWTGLTAAIRF